MIFKDKSYNFFQNLKFIFSLKNLSSVIKNKIYMKLRNLHLK